jgi:hypothetical protein
MLLVRVQRIEVEFQEIWVGVEKERRGWLHDIDSVDVPIRRDLFLEHERFGRVGVVVAGKSRWDGENMAPMVCRATSTTRE